VNETLSAALYSSFNVTQFARLLQNDDASPPISVERVHGLLSGAMFLGSGTLPRPSGEIAVIVTMPEAVLPSVAGLLGGRVCEPERLQHEVQSFAQTVCSLPVRLTLIVSWLAPNRYSGGLLALNPRYGLDGAVNAANAWLCEAFDAHPERRVLNASAWQKTLGEHAMSAKNWYLTKDPYSFDLWKLAVSDVKAAILSLLGRAKKLIILDLDNTLWGGELGDTGAEGLRLGGHDPVGEAYSAFQRELVTLAHRGVALGIASKNDEALALSAIDKHPEMIVRRDTLAGWIIDWEEKAANIRKLCARIGIAPSDALFIDDNPAERAAVAAAIPELTVPAWPANPMLFVESLRRLNVFDVPEVTAEDLARTRNYVAARALACEPRGVQTSIEVRRPLPADLPRVLQLLNKTNQFNLATRRFTASQLQEWLDVEGHDLWVARAHDAFADYGIVGALSVAVQGTVCTIVDFVMSCRVLFRGIEERMLEETRKHARERGCRLLEATFVPTERNEPMRRFLVERSGLANDDERHFSLDLFAALRSSA